MTQKNIINSMLMYMTYAMRCIQILSTHITCIIYGYYYNDQIKTKKKYEKRNQKT